MKNKSTLFLIICSSPLNGMIIREMPPASNPHLHSFFSIPYNFPKSVAESIETRIGSSILEKKEWWYLESIIYHERLIYEIGYNPIGTELIAKSDRLRIFDTKTLEQKASYSLDRPTELVNHMTTDTNSILTHKNTVRIIDTNTHEEVASFYHPDSTYAVSYNPARTHVATGSFDGYIRIFARHDNYTLDQMLLKKLFCTWLMVQKPDKNIDTIEKLFIDMASLFVYEHHKIDYEELIKIWNTFPEPMQIAIFETLRHKIQIYGKNIITYKKKKKSITFKSIIPRIIKNFKFPAHLLSS